MNAPQKQFRFSGRVAPHDQLHQVTTAPAVGDPPDEHYLAPTTVSVDIIVPPGRGIIGVPQYSPTVNGGPATGYDPAGDCEGNFMSCRFQPNNNCYAYGTNITTNTFPQPGRQSGYELTADDFTQPFATVGQTVASYAQRDGLIMVGTSMADVLRFSESGHANAGGAATVGVGPGHFVALMISPAGDANWPGDYHWARCDNSMGPCDSWSQKDGGDQVTNFDFAGHPITDPSAANWTVNQGPVADGSPDAGSDQIVEYAFYCFMYVPASGVNII